MKLLRPARELARAQRFAEVVRAGEVENRVAQEHQQLLVLAAELAAQGAVARLHDRALAHPLPELRLRRPELLAVAADHERRLLALLPLLFRRPQSLPSLSRNGPRTHDGRRTTVARPGAPK